MTEIELPTKPRADGAAAATTTVPVAVLKPLASRRLKVGLDAALPARSRLGVGYGNSSTYPIRFSIPDGQKKDVGFFRLFLSTTPSNFHCIAQPSPFEEQHRAQPQYAEPEVAKMEWWTMKTATVVQMPRCSSNVTQ